MNIIYFGTPPLSAHILEYLIQQGIHISAIVTRPDKPKGRSKKLLPSAVKILAQEKWPNIPVFSPEKASTDMFCETLKGFNPDVFVVVSYGEIIKENLLSVPSKKSINVHFSLLPKYRGAAPMQRTILAGEKETGITIIEMVLKMDAGDMLEIVKIPLEEDMTFGELEKKLTDLSGPALINVLKQIEDGTLQQVEQDHSRMTLAPKISFEDRIVNWGKSAQEIHNQIRGLSPAPGAFTVVDVEGQEKKMGIKRSKMISNQSGPLGKTLVWNKKEWVIACGDGAISLLEVQLEGKKSLYIEDFLRGQSKEIFIKNSNNANLH